MLPTFDNLRLKRSQEEVVIEAHKRMKMVFKHVQVVETIQGNLKGKTKVKRYVEKCKVMKGRHCVTIERSLELFNVSVSFSNIGGGCG